MSEPPFRVEDPLSWPQWMRDEFKLMMEVWTVPGSGQRKFMVCCDAERAPEYLKIQRDQGAKRKRDEEASSLDDKPANRWVLQSIREPSWLTVGVGYWYDCEVEMHTGEPKVAGPHELDYQRQTETTNTQSNARAQTSRL